MNWYLSICFLVTLPLYLPLPLDLHLYLFRSCICFHCCIWICMFFYLLLYPNFHLFLVFVFVFIFVFIFCIYFYDLVFVFVFFRGQFKCFVFQMDFYYFLGLHSSSFIFYEFDHILLFCSFFDLTCWAIRNDEWIGSIQIVLTYLLLNV